MNTEVSVELARRAEVHRALGDPRRLAIVDALGLSDRTPSELRRATGMGWSLLEFHLGALAGAGVIHRRVSDGDRRRRYVRLAAGVADELAAAACDLTGPVLFVCTANSARSPFAAALWHARTGAPAASAGREPAPSMHPLAVRVGAAHGVDLTGRRPCGYASVTRRPHVAVSVCDRAREDALPEADVWLHWSVPDPVGGERAAFEAAFADISQRVERLARLAQRSAA